MVQLREFASEVTRVSLEVGTEGKLGGTAVVRDVEGVWHELTVNVRMSLTLKFSCSCHSLITIGQPDVSKPNPASTVYCYCDNCCGKGSAPPTTFLYAVAYDQLLLGRSNQASRDSCRRRNGYFEGHCQLYG